mmetsp:Transcript_64993/g.163789  ORF Transcript_64993/g.163789 Transcript_64993/m.163789 type:complete len:276 (+) Transcript_64993:554-1381(+)
MSCGELLQAPRQNIPERHHQLNGVVIDSKLCTQQHVHGGAGGDRWPTANWQLVDFGSSQYCFELVLLPMAEFQPLIDLVNAFVIDQIHQLMVVSQPNVFGLTVHVQGARFLQLVWIPALSVFPEIWGTTFVPRRTDRLTNDAIGHEFLEPLEELDDLLRLALGCFRQSPDLREQHKWIHHILVQLHVIQVLEDSHHVLHPCTDYVRVRPQIAQEAGASVSALCMKLPPRLVVHVDEGTEDPDELMAQVYLEERHDRFFVWRAEVSSYEQGLPEAG